MIENRWQFGAGTWLLVVSAVQAFTTVPGLHALFSLMGSVLGALILASSIKRSMQ